MADLTAEYPRWAQTLAHGVQARLGNTFILHGNVHDLVAIPKSGQTAEFIPLTQFLADWIFGPRDVVIEYQRANGAIERGRIGEVRRRNPAVEPRRHKFVPSKRRQQVTTGGTVKVAGPEPLKGGGQLQPTKPKRRDALKGRPRRKRVTGPRK